VYKIKASIKFKKDVKQIQKSGRKKNDFTEIKWVIDQLAIPAVLPENIRIIRFPGIIGIIGNVMFFLIFF